ncbi:MAG: hypothetical protein ABH831_00180 [Candidatus Nealsonbacteria bacterium]
MRNLVGNIIFLFHAAFVIPWYALLFVPESVLPNKIAFHFYLTLVVVLHQFLWGFLIMPWTKKYRMVCILTTFQQLAKGQNISDPKNYDHSFTQEFLRKIGINIPHRASTLITFTILTLVSIQYFF